jgi:hypothetical protein
MLPSRAGITVTEQSQESIPCCQLKNPSNVYPDLFSYLKKTLPVQQEGKLHFFPL